MAARNQMKFYATLAALITSAMPSACSSEPFERKIALPEPALMTARVRSLFATTKLVCFGRYALEVPEEAELIWGGTSFPSRIEVVKGNVRSRDFKITRDVEKLRRADETAEITYNQEGPVPGSWQIRYYESDSAREYGLHFFKTYVTKGELTFILGGSVGKGNTEDAAAERQASRVKSLRLRGANEVPAEPGYCIEHAFMASETYSEQEMVNAGIYLPSLPDVTFSIGSNKDAYADYKPADFERMKRDELSLLARIKQAQAIQGAKYPPRDVLREGKRTVQHWHGEESLFKRGDGTHDFEWAFVGTPREVANPSEFNVTMFTKVAHNTVGAAEKASLTDAEAMALWDRLLSGLKFRVKVPGAPKGSYYFPPADDKARAKP